MSYHIVSIDSPECSISCKKGQLRCSTPEGMNSIPLEDVAAIVITSFSASIHSKLLLEAAKLGVALVVCEAFKPASLVLPANRSTDTLLTRAQISLPQKIRDNLWQKTINAKTLNQLSLAQHIAPSHKTLPFLEMTAKGRKQHKESICARAFWDIFGDTVAETNDFKRGQNEGGVNQLLNYGYAILLSTVLQNCFALGIDPTFGINHVVRERSTPLAYDLMEPFRPCVDWRVTQWVKQQPCTTDWAVTPEFRRWVTGFPTVKIDYFGLNLDIRSCIEGVIRSFRKALIEQKSGLYKPWTHSNSKWAG
ncbi:type II CRISPR-associated endonuclease Cas1 [Verrucomicrobiaceae bacterium R5-34]|nr:type II CRISPR-associated endonuclease Cas1 [Verrucomicrobiaceae bacterium R5-34]